MLCDAAGDSHFGLSVSRCAFSIHSIFMELHRGFCECLAARFTTAVVDAFRFGYGRLLTSRWRQQAANPFSRPPKGVSCKIDARTRALGGLQTYLSTVVQVLPEAGTFIKQHSRPQVPKKDRLKVLHSYTWRPPVFRFCKFSAGHGFARFSILLMVLLVATRHELVFVDLQPHR